MNHIEIDLNVRTHYNWTYTGFEDCEYIPRGGDEVEVYETGYGLHGQARVMIVDYRKQLVYLRVPWSELIVSTKYQKFSYGYEDTKWAIENSTVRT